MEKHQGGDSDPGSVAVSEPVKKHVFDRMLDWALARFNSFVNFLFDLPRIIVDRAIAAITFLAGIMLSLREWAKDPFRLRVHGESLLGTRSRSDLATYGMLLGLSGAFELFAWSNMWGYSGIGGIAFYVLPVIFSVMVILLDRGILIMNDQNGWPRRIAAVGFRVAMLLLLACITSVPIELRVFAPEIDRVQEDAEKVKIDAIREKARGYEEGLEKKQTSAADTMLTGAPESVVSRRQAERQALILEQHTNRADIVRRLEAKSEDLAEEIANGTRTGTHGDGQTANALRRQEGQLRDELEAFDHEASAQLSAFDRETETMRASAVKSGVDAEAAQATSLDVKLHRIETMQPDELSKAYGGEYKEPNGFLARYRILLGIVATPDGTLGYFTRNELIVWGCRIVMILFGLSVLFVKFLMTSEETVAYYSLKAQALNGDADSVRVLRTKALAGDQDAVNVMRVLSKKDPECAAVLEVLGFDGSIESATWTSDVVELHRRLFAARSDLSRALASFRQAFRGMCRERVVTNGRTHALSRDQLSERAEAAWRTEVQTKIHAEADARAAMQFRGVQVKPWPMSLEEEPPSDGRRLWQLPDEDLEREFGWSSADPAPALSIAKSP